MHAKGLHHKAASRGLEIRSSPANGWLSSRIKKIAPEADKANTNRIAIRVGLSRENKLKLANMKASQNTSTVRNGTVIESPPCSNRSKRVCAKSLLTATALSLSTC